MQYAKVPGHQANLRNFFGFPLGDYTVKNMVSRNAEEPGMEGYAEGCFACLSVCR